MNFVGAIGINNPWRMTPKGNASPIQASQNRFNPSSVFCASLDSIRFGAKSPSKNGGEKQVAAKIELSEGFLKRLDSAAKTRGLTIGEYLQELLPQFRSKAPEKRVANQSLDTVTGMHQGKPVKTQVKTLLGPEQIFDAWIAVLKQTKQYAQISMYNFENEAVAGGRGTDGADISQGWQKQQQILKLIEEKAAKGVRFQFILDNSVIRGRDEFGNPIFPRSHTNAGMIQYLRELKEKKGLPIDVIEFPRNVAHIYHVKLLVSDGKRAIVGGMNLSNHSAANWDACVSIEGPEVANIQQETFHPDWIFAQKRKFPKKPLADIRAQLPQIEPVSHPAIQVLNTLPREYKEIGLAGKEGIGNYVKQKLNSPGLTDIHSEQFITTHKEIKESLINLFEKGANIKLLHSSSVVDQFPYSRKAVFELIKKGLPIRFYNEWEDIGQKLHAKWTVFNKNEVLIGSANLSARGLETNLKPGVREDYPNHPGQRYTRGNRDMAIVIPSKKIAGTFLKQFDLDWQYSPPIHPGGYGQFEKAFNLPHFNKLVQDVLRKLS